MRERIKALGGGLSIEALHPNGLGLRAQIPVPSTAMRSSETMDAA
jgi:signal transduction histidine kinase